MRQITVLATALALLPAVAQAQTPTPTATATATPTASATKRQSRTKDVQAVYDDYSRDSVIDVCDHTEATLQKTLDSIEPSFDQDYPDFRAAVEAGIQKHKDGGCPKDTSSGSSGSTSAGAGAGAGAGSTGTGTGAGAGSTATPAPTSTPESGQLPPDATPQQGKGGAVPPEDQIPPPTATPANPAITPIPQATVPPPAPTAAPTPAVVHSGHRSLLLPLLLIGLALLGLAALGLSAYFGRNNPRVAHAWREAAFRTRGTWADFSDWLRLGR